MTQQEYEALQKQLNYKRLHPPYDRFAFDGAAYRLFGREQGIQEAQNILYDFYQGTKAALDGFEVIKE